MAAGTVPAEYRELADDELVSRLREAKEELFNLRFQVATGQLDNNRRLQTVRRDIARIYTIMRERELAGRPGAGPGDAPEPVGAGRTEGAADDRSDRRHRDGADG